MLRLSCTKILAAHLALSISSALAATVTHNFDIGWVQANPDGLAERPVIGINGQWPIPPIVITKGDRLVVHVRNQLGNETTSLHFHGIYQNGTNYMDGAATVTQCDIAPGSTLTYNFTINQPGTYWYHSHSKGQYPDGLRGPLIVKDNDSPFKDQYDEEVVLTFSDWYHDEMRTLLESFISVTNPSGAEPVPAAALMNDTQNLTFAVQPGRNYLFRMINVGAFAAQYVWFENHTMRIVEVDGIYTQPAEAEMIYMTAAQRYSVLITAKNETGANFPFVASMDQDLFDTVPDGLNPNVTGWLMYDSQKEQPDPAELDEFDPFDDYQLVPQDQLPLLDKVDYSFTLDMKMDNLLDGANYAFFNDVTYMQPKVPTLYSVLSSGPSATNAQIYGENSNAFILEKDDVVEIILNNDDPGKHPFHLHGHAFQLAARSDEEAGAYDSNNVSLSQTPMRRDTVLVHPNGNIVLRFKADNPGVWLFHCHIEWHMASGLVATLIESPLDIQANLTIPADHLQACRDANVPTTGNAAGNTVDLLDLTGANVSPPPLPEGFTPRGIVALTFSILAALLGCAVVTWYGLVPLDSKAAAAKQEVLSRGANSSSEGVGGSSSE